MANLVVTGMQWGDEGKGKLVDLLCPAFEAVARFQGGHNAGHTVKFGDQHFSLHLIPSGIVHPGTKCVLGNGMVVAPDAFFRELSRLADGGVKPAERLYLSERAQVLLPLHALLDKARETARGERSIGTTTRGIGPAYESKASRAGLRVCDLTAPDLEVRLAELLSRGEAELRGQDGGVKELAAQCRQWGKELAPFRADTARLLNGWIAAGERVLFEGAQGALLDLDHGTYPYVTSSNTTTGAAATGTGVPPRALGGVLGVLKAYTTRVGGGPFPTELEDADGERLRRRGNEFGTTTGRPRRCGWFDAVAAAYAAMLDGVDAIALTKLDVLDDCEEIPVCTAYRVGSQESDELPADAAALAAVEPVYTTLPGWRQDTTGTLDYEKLPAAARDYIAFIEERVGAPVVLVSTGPRREETILRQGHPALERLLPDRLEAVLAGRGA